MVPHFFAFLAFIVPILNVPTSPTALYIQEPYSSIDGRFIINFPDMPVDEGSYETEMFFGITTAHKVSTYHDNVLYGIQWMEWPTFIAKNIPEVTSGFIVSTVPDTIPGSYTFTDRTEQEGYPTHIITIKSRQYGQDYLFKFHAVNTNDIQYIIFTAYRGIAPEPHIENFFSSFSILVKEEVKSLKQARRIPLRDWRYLLPIGVILCLMGSIITGWGALNQSRPVIGQPEIWRNSITGCVTVLLSLLFGITGVLFIWISAGAAWGIITILIYLFIWQLWAFILAGIGL